jgi:hypothetical protein
MLRTIKTRLFELFSRDGKKLSTTLFWSNIGYAVMSWAVITKVINSTASDDLLLIYISVTAMHTTASNLLSKYNFKGKSDVDHT